MKFTPIRKLLVLLLVIGPAVPSVGQAPAGAGPDEWRQFRGNPALTGVAASSPPAALKVLWTYDVGETIESSAAIADGVVYVGAGNGELIALDLASGNLRWKYSTENLIERRRGIVYNSIGI